MSIIESFPTEILQEITQLLPTSLKNLRLTCKRFNDAIVPQMFSHITIDFNYKRPDDCKRFLESLVSRTHSSVLHAKSVTIDGMNSLFRGDKWLPLDVQMIVELLPLAIRAFVNANAMVIDKHSNGKGIASSVSELATLTSLELDIRINIADGDCDVLITSDGPTPEMSNYLARSSNRLRDLTLDCRDSEPANPEPLLKILGPLPNITHLCLLGYFLQLNSTITPGLKSLISLTLKNAADPETRVMRDLYLRARGSFLYNILETLVIEDMDIIRAHTQTIRGGLLQLHALGAHAASLQKLWCFGDHNSWMLQTLINLKFLSMPVTYDLYQNVPDVDLYDEDYHYHRHFMIQ
ncbi:hypothetical protein BDQ17DRAFT_1362388 [Cyathus striatus]|nr:hypothetical protein BDQ17DRAFT_1362388 [Cyathus striatus]